MSGQYIDGSDLTDEWIGKSIGWDGDAPMVYGGMKPHPDGDPEHVLVTLDGREIALYTFDYVWVEDDQVPRTPVTP